jgi:predicted nucleic acid-binding protein
LIYQRRHEQRHTPQRAIGLKSMDKHIAAAARVRRAAIATRDSKEFLGADVNLVNPWKE